MRCQTTSGAFQCDAQHGHTGECITCAKPYASATAIETRAKSLAAAQALLFAREQIFILSRVAECARLVLGSGPESEHYEERLADLVNALSELE